VGLRATTVVEDYTDASLDNVPMEKCVGNGLHDKCSNDGDSVQWVPRGILSLQRLMTVATSEDRPD
jgi:hypothetical protein